MTKFADYVAAGWQLCTIPPGSKGPRTKGWQQKGAYFDPNSRGAGLCHAWSGTCSIDVDHYEIARAWLLERHVDLDALIVAVDSVHISSGREGRAKLIYALPVPLASIQVAPYQVPDPETGKPKTFHALEFRCASKEGLTVQDVLPPTIHPVTGNPYKWEYGDDLVGDWSKPPELPPELARLWKLELGPVQAAAGPQAPKGAEFAEIRELLAQVDPVELAYDEWLEVGIRLHHETKGAAAGYALWREWSVRSPKHDDTHMPVKWASFRFDAKNPLTLGGLRRQAIAKAEDFPIVTEDTSDVVPEVDLKELLGKSTVYVTSLDLYFNLEKVSLFPSDRAVRNEFCPQIPHVVGEDGKVTKTDPVTWLQNYPARLDAHAIGMHPGMGRLFKEDGKNYVNHYTRREIVPLRPSLQEREAFEFLWSRIPDPVFASWMMKFYAHALMKPGIKIRSAPILFSYEQGTGKSTVAHTLPKLLFGAVTPMTAAVVQSPFNDPLANAWWVTFPEFCAGNTKSERMWLSDHVKDWVTDEEIQIHPKGLKPYYIKNRLQFTATSNRDDALQIDNTDRRWAVCHFSEKRLKPAEVLDLYQGFLLTARAPGVLQYLFREVDLTGFQPAGAPPETQAKKAMIQSGLGAWESAIVEDMNNLRGPFGRDLFTMDAAHEHFTGRGPSSMHATRDMLRRPPFNCQQITRGVGKKRFWAWRNFDFWQSKTESQRVDHMEQNVAPFGRVDEIPAAVLALSADAVADDSENPCADLA